MRRAAEFSLLLTKGVIGLWCQAAQDYSAPSATLSVGPRVPERLRLRRSLNWCSHLSEATGSISREISVLAKSFVMQINDDGLLRGDAHPRRLACRLDGRFPP